jgi:hypothetical protein
VTSGDTPIGDALAAEQAKAAEPDPTAPVVSDADASSAATVASAIEDGSSDSHATDTEPDPTSAPSAESVQPSQDQTETAATDADSGSDAPLDDHRFRLIHEVRDDTGQWLHAATSDYQVGRDILHHVADLLQRL